jgi:DnaJ domain
MNKHILLLVCTMVVGTWTTIHSITVTLLNDTNYDIILFITPKNQQRHLSVIRPHEKSTAIDTDETKEIELRYRKPSAAQTTAVKAGIASQTQPIDLPNIVSKAQQNNALIHVRPGYLYGFSLKIDYEAPAASKQEPTSSRPVPEEEEYTEIFNPEDEAYKVLGVRKNSTAAEILKIQPNATAEDIRDAYRALVAKWGPEQYKGSNKQLADTIYKMVGKAYKEALPPLGPA